MAQIEALEINMAFTFHYVSIKSHAVNVRIRQPCKFTFHYVSIKSDNTTYYLLRTHIYLHSTMYLLNRSHWTYSHQAHQFTFHYVSIKSKTTSDANVDIFIFTFHYVSIKSRTATPYHFSSLFCAFLSTYHHSW